MPLHLSGDTAPSQGRMAKVGLVARTKQGLAVQGCGRPSGITGVPGTLRRRRVEVWCLLILTAGPAFCLAQAVAFAAPNQMQQIGTEAMQAIRSHDLSVQEYASVNRSAQTDARVKQRLLDAANRE